MDNREKVIHFNSPEGPVWRYKTAEDNLLEMLQEKETEKSMVERGWSKHTKFFGQHEVEEHQSALTGNRVCYYCLAELEEKYGIEQAIKIGHIDFA